MSGWANINSIYNKYTFEFISKIFIGIMIMMTFLYWGKNLIYIAFALCLVTLSYSLYYLFKLTNHRNSNFKIRMMYWVDFSLMFGLTIFFFGFLLVIGKLVSTYYIAVFALPYFATTLFVLFYNPEDKIWIS